VVIVVTTAFSVVDILLKVSGELLISVDIYRACAIPVILPMSLFMLFPVFFGKKEESSIHKSFERNLSRIIVLGVLILIFFSFISAGLHRDSFWGFDGKIPFLTGESRLFQRDGTWLRLGFVIEALVLSFGLAYKQRKYDQERLVSLDRNALTLGGRHLESHLIHCNANNGHQPSRQTQVG